MSDAGRDLIGAGAAWVSAVGCEELGRLGLLNTSDCCARCHSAEQYRPVRFFLGPCHATLPDGRTASVCCTGKKRLLDGERDASDLRGP